MGATIRRFQDIPYDYDMPYDGFIWDSAASHRNASVVAFDLPLATLPAYCPEFNPADRVIRSLRYEP